MKYFFTPLFLLFFINIHAQFLIDEHFDGDVLPAGWTQTTFAADGGWLLGDNYELGSAIFQVSEHGNFIGTNDKCFCDHNNDFLKSPTIDLTGYSQLWLMFDYSFLDFAPQTFSVEISTNGGVSWTVLDDLSFSGIGLGWWGTNYYDLSAYAGYSNVKIGFRYSDGGDWWSYGASLDNVKLFQPFENDISLDSFSVENNFTVTGTGITLNGLITNYGTDNLHSFTAIWNDGAINNSVEISGIDVAQFETYHFSHDVPYIPASPIKYDVELSAVDPNGTDDLYLANNALTIDLHGCSSKPDKRVLAELATGTWCSWCVRGHVYMDSMYILFPQDFVGIAVHNNDPMEVIAYDSSLYAYQNFLSYSGGAAYPSIIGEHKYYMDPLDMPYKLTPFMDQTVPAGIQVYGIYNDVTGILHIDLKTSIVSKLNAIDYRFNLVLTEDSVTGTTAGYDQSNAYADGYAGDMAGYELLPDPVPAEDMVFDHVARYLADTWHGAEGSIPADVNDLDTFYRSYDISIDDDWEKDKLNIIGMIYDFNTGKMVNTKEVHFRSLAEETPDTSTNDTTIVESILNMNEIPSVKLYPNPADAFSSIAISTNNPFDTYLMVTDIAGKIVATKNYGLLSGDQNLIVNTALLEQGIYFISIRFNDYVINKQLTVYH